jgi:hypothetical protein
MMKLRYAASNLVIQTVLQVIAALVNYFSDVLWPPVFWRSQRLPSHSTSYLYPEKRCYIPVSGTPFCTTYTNLMSDGLYWNNGSFVILVNILTQRTKDETNNVQRKCIKAENVERFISP